ncbi:polyamine transporter 3 [Hypoxylon sp. FL1284]|nr:polyamine transporter 3 [Hypoxylon sp. FL1284]
MPDPIHLDRGIGEDGGESDAAGTQDAASGNDSIAGEKQQRRPSQASHMSGASDDSDPLSPLELALSPGAEAFEEMSRVRTGTSIGSAASRPPDYEIAFEDDDPDNPRNWPLSYRGWVVFSISYTTWVIAFYSTCYTASLPGLVAEFGYSTTITTLGVTTYLLGLALGSLILAPASELYGRRPVYIISMICFTLFVIPCALATSLVEIIIFRFFGAIFGAVMIVNSPGTVVDISTEEYRGLVMSLWSIAPLNGPVTGPVIGGFVYQYLGWRWDNWLVLILAGVGVVCMLITKETYAPVILRKKAARRRKEDDDERWWCRYDEKLSKAALMKVSLLRPFVLAFAEPILWFFNTWISLVYGILYLCFVAYPIVFTQYRGWGPGITGLSFIGIGIGTTIAILAEPLWRRIINAHQKDPETGRVPPEATARIMIIASILAPVGQLVFSWTCLPVTIHWAVPIAFGIPFGAGTSLSFIYGSSYLAGTYGIYAASALASNSMFRSILGGTLPLAGPSMYAALTPQWAGTLLGLLEALMIPIPLVFYRYGERIRARSPIIRQMREDQERNERRAARARRSRNNNDKPAPPAQARETGLAEHAEDKRDLEKGAAGAETGNAPAWSKDETAV